MLGFFLNSITKKDDKAIKILVFTYLNYSPFARIRHLFEYVSKFELNTAQLLIRVKSKSKQ